MSDNQLPTQEETERYPAYPHSPEVYATADESDPERKWFVARGAVFENGHYLGGFGGTVSRIKP